MDIIGIVNRLEEKKCINNIRCIIDFLLLYKDFLNEGVNRRARRASRQQT